MSDAVFLFDLFGTQAVYLGFLYILLHLVGAL